MKIVFGTYGIKIKSLTSKDLDRNSNTNNIYEVKQKCFHIVYLPILPIGKEYLVKKNDVIFKASKKEIQQIKALGKIRTPWFCFVMPLFIAFSILALIIENELPQYKEKIERREKYEYGVNNMKQELSRLSTDHYFKFRNPKSKGYRNSIFLKVIKESSDSIVFHKLETSKLGHEIYPYELEKFYYDNIDELDTITIWKAEIDNAICNNAKILWSREFEGVSLIGDDSKYFLENIIDLKGPVIQGIESSYGPHVTDLSKYYWNGELVFHNYGKVVKLMEIENIIGKIEWTNELPMLINTDSSRNENFVLLGENHKKDEIYKFKMKFLDSANNEFTYLVEGINRNKRIKKL